MEIQRKFIIFVAEMREILEFIINAFRVEVPVVMALLLMGCGGGNDVEEILSTERIGK